MLNEISNGSHQCDEGCGENDFLPFHFNDYNANVKNLVLFLISFSWYIENCSCYDPLLKVMFADYSNF